MKKCTINFTNSKNYIIKFHKIFLIWERQNKMSKQLEDKIQSYIVAEMWNNYPQTRGLLVYTNNNAVNRIKGAILKAMGIIAGHPDLTFYYNCKVYFIELKTFKGELSEAQIKQHQRLKNQGFEVRVFYTDTGIEVIEFLKNIIGE